MATALERLVKKYPALVGKEGLILDQANVVCLISATAEELAGKGGPMAVQKELREALLNWIDTSGAEADDGYVPWPPVKMTPTALMRADGVFAFYPGINVLCGNSEGCKTWIALNEALRLSRLGRCTLWIDLEAGRDEIAWRLMVLGATEEEAARIYHCSVAERMNGERAEHLVKAASEHGPLGLIVIETMTAVVAHEAGVNPDNSATAIERLYSRLRQVSSLAEHVPLVVVDHLNKEGDLLGSIRKRTGVKGSVLRTHVDRELTWTETGVVSIEVEKDGNGGVKSKAMGRGKGTRRAWARVELTPGAAGDGTELTIAIEPYMIVAALASAAASFKTGVKMDELTIRILEGVESGPEIMGDLEAFTRGDASHSTFQRRIRALEKVGYIERTDDPHHVLVSITHDGEVALLSARVAATL